MNHICVRIRPISSIHDIERIMKMDPRTSRIINTANHILQTIPSHVTLQAAAKGRSLEEVEAVIQAGVTRIGYNYIQEAIPIIRTIGNRASWHMIGHLQRNKAKLAVNHFDMIETIDSWRLAQAVERYCTEAGKRISVLVEINSGREANKTGVFPEDAEEFLEKLSTLEHLRIEGLMTMGPRFGNPEDSRPFFVTTRNLFDHFSAQNILNVEMKYLSMGMSNSYAIAIEEGANIIRIGTRIFGEREIG